MLLVEALAFLRDDGAASPRELEEGFAHVLFGDVPPGVQNLVLQLIQSTRSWHGVVDVLLHVRVDCVVRYLKRNGKK